MRTAFALGTLFFVASAVAAPAADDPITVRAAQVARLFPSYKEVGNVKTVNAGAFTAKTVVLAEIVWVPKPEMLPQQATASIRAQDKFSKMTEEERLKVADRYREEVQIWWVEGLAGKDAPALVKELQPPARSVRRHCETVYLGNDGKRAWFACMPIYEWIRLQESVRLEGGEDPMASAVRGLGIEDQGDLTRNNSTGILESSGPKALPAIDATIAAKHPQRIAAVAAMGPSKDKAVTAWLIERADSPDDDVKTVARWALCVSPRAEARDLYVKWLGEAIKSRKFRHELEACAAVNAEAARPLLADYLKAPENSRAYRLAFEFWRKLSGKPLPADLLAAEHTVIRAGIRGNAEYDPDKADAATQTIIHHEDVEAAAVVGISLALFVAKADTREVRNAGEQILREVKGGKELAHRLAESSKDYDQDRLKRLESRLKD